MSLRRRAWRCCWPGARHVKILPGRKTDVGDAAWLARAVGARPCCGAASCRRPRSAGCGILSATASGRFQATARKGQRVQKVLEDAGIKLDLVAADVLGVSGRAMLAALIAGERDPGVLPELARGRLRAKLPQLRARVRRS
jgi:transposase